jgi:lysophospholipase L1-like esterase
MEACNAFDSKGFWMSMQRQNLFTARVRGLLVVVFTGLAMNSAAAQMPTGRGHLKFDFGMGKAAQGYAKVLTTTMYSKEVGYGFESGAALIGVGQNGGAGGRADSITGDKPFYFSVALPEGNYQVKVTFGNARGVSDTTVKAELRRLMLENVQTAYGKFLTRTFTVNIRVPHIKDGGEVKLKDREKTTEIWAWDEKLTLEFNGSRPAVCALEISRADTIPTIFLLGDSTVCDQPTEPYNSWGQMLTRFFKPGVAIANHAESGESLRSSLAAGRLKKVLSLMRRGDYLFIQYGHNDQKEKGEGVGAFTTYKTDLKHFVTEARRRGGIPVLLTSVNRRNFNPEGEVFSTLGDYPEAARQLAKEEGVPLIDLNLMSKTLYEALGEAKSVLLFKEGDGTHHNNYGSYELAKCVVEGIRANRLAIGKYLADDLAAFEPGRPDPFEAFKVPASPQRATVKPLGN